jgi:phosphoesterase RecJ-like protein
VKTGSRIIERVLEAIAPCRTICVVGHIRPDGDCVGSQLGLTLALEGQGKKVTCWNEDPLPGKLAFLDPGKRFKVPQSRRRFDCVIATDCASFERLGSVGECVRHRKTWINIDHHASNTRYGEINWISARAPSTGDLIYRLLKVARWPITRPIADCLFTAISTDTGSFQYPTTRPSSYHAAGDLVSRGADLARICHEVYQSFPLSRVRLLQHLYSHFRLASHDRIAYVWLKKRDFVRSGATPADTEGLIDHIRAIEPVVVACVFEELAPNLTRVSLRSKSERVNVNEIAIQFGGGGHRASAGARIPGNPHAVQRRVLAAVRAALP